MAVKPTTPDRSDLESKSREDLQAIAKQTGAVVSGRASKATLIETIMGSSPSVDAPVPASRAVRSRRTVATPEDDFESLLNEFTAEPSAPAPVGSSSDARVPANSRRRSSSDRAVTQETLDSSNGANSTGAHSNGASSNGSASPSGAATATSTTPEATPQDSSNNRQGNSQRCHQ